VGGGEHFKKEQRFGFKECLGRRFAHAVALLAKGGDRRVEGVLAIVVQGGDAKSAASQHTDSKLSRVAAGLPTVRGMGTGRKIGVSDAGAFDRVESDRCIADTSRDDPFANEPVPLVPKIGAQRDPPATRLQTDQPARAGGDPDRAAPVVGVGNGDHAGGHRRGTATARASRRMSRVPGVAGRAESLRLGGRSESELGGVGATDRNQSSRLETRAQHRVMRGAKARLAQQPGAHRDRVAGAVTAQILVQTGHPIKGPARQRRVARLLPRAFEERRHHRAQAFVGRFHPGDCRVDQLER
jgi:hypothetical protein